MPVLCWLLQAKHTDLSSLTDNVVTDDTRDYQTKSYREKVRWKPHFVPCSGPGGSGRRVGLFPLLQAWPPLGALELTETAGD